MCGGGCIRDTVGFYPQEAQGRLAVVNEPKWSPVIRSLICPLGARERSGGLITAPGPWRSRGCRGGDGGERGGWCLSPQLDSLTGDEALLVCFSCYNDASLNGSGQREKLVTVTPIYQFDWLIKNIMLTSAVLATSDIM